MVRDEWHRGKKHSHADHDNDCFCSHRFSCFQTKNRRRVQANTCVGKVKWRDLLRGQCRLVLYHQSYRCIEIDAAVSCPSCHLFSILAGPRQFANRGSSNKNTDVRERMTSNVATIAPFSSRKQRPFTTQPARPTTL